MKIRLKPLFVYVKSLYEEYIDELRSLSNNEQRIHFLLTKFEEDVESLSLHKQQLYNLKDFDLSIAGITFSYI